MFCGDFDLSTLGLWACIEFIVRVCVQDLTQVKLHAKPKKTKQENIRKQVSCWRSNSWEEAREQH